MTPSRPPRRSSLFRRIYQTFVVTVLFATGAVGTGAWLLARALSNEWITDTIERLGEDNDALVELIDARDQPAIDERLANLGNQLDTHVGIYGVDGRRIAGEGPEEIPKRVHRHNRELARGRPVVDRLRTSDRQRVLFPLTDPDDDELVGVVHVVARVVPPLPFAVPMLVALLGALGLGAWQLSRSITRRLGALEHSVGRIAKGELDHRVAVPEAPVDELDELGDAVNEMARRIERLVSGQRTLLANVSHELRTPIARMKVLLEILQERIAALSGPSDAQRGTARERLRTGLDDMARDVVEVEALIGDLLTSGRLELRAEGVGIEAHELDLRALLERVVPRFAAEIDVPAAESVRVRGDELLLERLFSNLLANAR
ncbi:MAG: HAMP domain-containing protein, partial [Deltaproteobacteria bacterium]|nr:HAMP domain-containing protein [Nannocystaceae bacterium]